MKSDAAVRELASELAYRFMVHRYGTMKEAMNQGQSEDDWFEKQGIAYDCYHDLLSRVFAPKETTK